MADSNRQTETANGSVQLPVRWRIQANASGDMIPATAPAAFSRDFNDDGRDFRLRPHPRVGRCYVGEIMLDLSDHATPHNGPIRRYS
jgi:hypothetical protein